MRMGGIDNGYASERLAPMSLYESGDGHQEIGRSTEHRLPCRMEGRVFPCNLMQYYCIFTTRILPRHQAWHLAE